jgi:hypothetical protein
MHVRRSGHEAEHQINGTTSESEESTHPTESNRSHGSALQTHVSILAGCLFRRLV